MNTDIMAIDEVAAHLKRTEKTACRLAAEGEITGFFVGVSSRLKKTNVEVGIDKKTIQ